MRGKAVFYPMGWDDNGLPTERRVQNYFGVRCDPALPYDPGFEPPATPARRAAGRLPAELRRALPTPDRRGRAGLRGDVGGPSGCRSTGAWPTPPSTRAPGAPPSAASCACSAAGHVYQSEAPTLWDVDFRTAVSQAELEDRERPGAYHRLPLRPGRRAAATSRSRPPGPSCCRPAWPWWPTPTTQRYRPLFGTDVRHPAVRRAGAGGGPRAGRPRQGLGHRHGLHLRRHHRRDVVARARPAHPDPRRAQRPPRAGALGRAGLGVRPTPGRRPATTASWPARRSSQAQAADRRAPGRGGRPGRRAPTDHPPGQVLRAGRAAARDRLVSPVVRADPDHPRAAAGPGRGAAAGTRPTWPTATAPGWRDSTPTGTSAASASSGCPSRSGTRWATTARSTTTGGSPPPRPACRSTPRPTSPTATARTSGAGPGASSATPTSWTPGPPRSLTPQIAGRWEDDPDLFARVFPMDLRPQAHEIIRTWLFSTVVRAELEFNIAALDRRRHLGLGPRPRPQEDVQVQGQRRHPAAPPRSNTAPTPCATGRPAAGPAPTPPSTRAR